MRFIFLILLVSQFAWGADRNRIWVDAKHPPEFKNLSETATITYKLVNHDSADHLARLVRSFTPATSKIHSYQDTGVLVVTDTGESLKRVYELVKKNDVKPTPQMIEKWRQIEKAANDAPRK